MSWFRIVELYLAGQLILFALIKFIFRAPWTELVGPYLAFAASMMTTFFIVWFLNSCANIKAKPRSFALGAGFCALFLVLSADGAFAYLGLALGFLTQQLVSDWTNWAFIILPLPYFRQWPSIKVLIVRRNPEKNWNEGRFLCAKLFSLRVIKKIMSSPASRARSAWRGKGTQALQHHRCFMSTREAGENGPMPLE